jgi:hypothetical protein
VARRGAPVASNTGTAGRPPLPATKNGKTMLRFEVPNEIAEQIRKLPVLQLPLPQHLDVVVLDGLAPRRHVAPFGHGRELGEKAASNTLLCRAGLFQCHRSRVPHLSVESLHASLQHDSSSARASRFASPPRLVAASQRR